jgi:hypothetical protein
MTTPDWFHEMEDDLYGAGDTLLASGREGIERTAWTPELGGSGTYHAERARQVTWRESERVLSLQRLMGG